MKTKSSMQDLGRNHTGDEELSREQWIGRFALRLAMLDDIQHPLEQLLQMGDDLWSTYGGSNPRSLLTLSTERVCAGKASAPRQCLSRGALIRPGPLQLEKDIRTQSCNYPFMELQTGRVFEPEVVEIDGYWVHVAVAQDLRFPDLFQCEVALYWREVDSDWSDLDLHKPVNVPQILREFTTPAAAYEHGLALGHILTSIY